MEFFILGSFEARRAGGTLRLGGYRQRACLAVLLVNANRILPASRLIDLTWDYPPLTADSVLHNYISRLRAVLDQRGGGDNGWQLIRTHESGYELRVDPESVDAGRFERGLAVGRRHRTDGEVHRAIESIEAALAEWRGTPLLDFANEGFAVGEASRLQQLQLAAVEELVEMQLGLGRWSEALERLEGFVRSAPLNESLRAHHIRALVAGNRQADALASFEALRHALAEELGVDPSEDLVEMHRKVLRHEALAPEPHEAERTSSTHDHRADEPSRDLPVSVTTFVGRERELSDVAELLRRDDTPLLSLTGPGGIGKTRLALRVAETVAERYPDGVRWINLASVRDAALVVPSVAGTLGVSERSGVPLAEGVADNLRGRQMLVVLDNCDHLLSEAANIAGTLRDAQGPTVLVTSRERLHLEGEQAWPVPPLDDDEGVALFAARARSIDPSFAVTAQTRELCEALEQLPLAIELAAARTTIFSVEQLQERIGQRLDLFKRTGEAEPRQRTLRATVGWSYNLLTAAEQKLFRWFSVFVGGASIDAIEHVCATEPDDLQSLLDKSLIRRRDAHGVPRFSMLETIREFAGEALEASDEGVGARSQHMRWFSTQIAALHMRVREGEQRATSALIDDLPNARAAVATAIATENARALSDLLMGLWWYWLTEGYGKEARRAVDAWLAMDRDALTELEAVPGLFASGEILRFTGDVEVAGDLKRALLAIAGSHPNDLVHGYEMQRLEAATLSDLSETELIQGRIDEARSLAGRALAVRRARGEPRGIAHALISAGIVELVADEPSSAKALFAEAVNRLMGADAPDRWNAELYLAESEIRMEALDPAAVLIDGCLEELLTAPVPVKIADLLRVAAGFAIETGDYETAAQLTGAFVHILEDAGLPGSGDALAGDSNERLRRDLVDAIGESAFESATTRGSRLDREEALDLVRLVMSAFAGSPESGRGGS